MTTSAKRPVAILGATGAVGQAFVRLLADHPWFEIGQVAASERSVGKSYAEATHWLGAAPIPEQVARMRVVPCDPLAVSAQLVFSALDAAAAIEIEAAFAKAGKLVLSNTSSYRMDSDVPLVIPEVNPDHLSLLPLQRKNRGWAGAIVTNANCAAIPSAMALAPLHAQFGVRRVVVVTMQAVSGAGYPGVPSLDILGNVIPFIKNEEGKIETEINKMLGSFDGHAVTPAPFVVSAHANRVAVENGHTICLSVECDRAVSPEQAADALRAWTGHAEARSLPSAPERALIYSDAPDHPQPRVDAMLGRGMSVVAGRMRRDPVFHVKFAVLAHNVIRGAAGAAVLNAELLASRGLLDRS